MKFLTVIAVSIALAGAMVSSIEPKQAQAKQLITLTSGIQYIILKSGNGGAKPKASDTVTVHYEGTLLNGKVFDSSYQRGQPATFPLSQVIPGWTEVVQLMSVGDKWAVTIPPHMAYGNRAVGNLIPANSTLKFCGGVNYSG